MNCKANVMESSKGEGKRLLRTLELKAFRSVVDALRAQGSFNSRKCSVLKNLAATLKVGDERCRSEMRRAVNDNMLNYIAQCSGEPNSEENWRLESARKVARVPMVNEPSVFTTLADKVSDWVLSHNRNTVEQESSLMDILESKKCRTDANASRYHTSKLLRPLLTTPRNAEEIAMELEKIRAHSKLSNNKMPVVKKVCSSVTKPPTEVPVPIEIPKISNPPVENAPPKEHMEVESDRNDVSVSSCPPKDTVEVQNNVQNNVPNKSRRAKSRSRSRPKRSQSTKSTKVSSLQEELGRTVSAMNALVVPVTEPSVAAKRPNDSTNIGADESQPKEKRSKIDTSKKVLPDSEVGKNKPAGVRIVEMKSSVVHESVDKAATVCSAHQKDDSVADAPPETVTSANQSKAKLTEESPSALLEKDFTPHTFNLIPASRRLKMVKKKENSNGSPLVKEPEQVAPAENRQMQNASSLTSRIEMHHANIRIAPEPLLKDYLASTAINKYAQALDRKKEADEKLKTVVPVLSQTKKTLSLLGNIKVRNLNAKAEDEPPVYPVVVSSKNKEVPEMEVENEDELVESDLDQSEFESGSTGDSAEYSTFGDSDAHSVIEYWDHEDDEDIMENGGHLDCDDVGFGKSKNYNEKIFDDDALRNNQGVVSDEVSSDLEFNGEIVEEIVEDEEFFTDDAESYESDDSDKLIFDYRGTMDSSSCDGEENYEEIKSINSAKKPGIRTLLPKNTASNASVSRSSAPVKNSSAPNVSTSQNGDSKVETGPLTKSIPLAPSATVSILKLRKPLAVGAASELPKEKEVVVVAPQLPKTVAINVRNEKSPSASPSYQMIPPSKCIVRGQTISLANARLIKAAPRPSQSTGITSGSTTDLPKITIFSSGKAPTSADLQLPSSASKRVILPQSAKNVNTSTSSVKYTPFKPSTVPIPKKICRLYDLMDVSEPSFSKLSAHQNAKKKSA